MSKNIDFIFADSDRFARNVAVGIVAAFLTVLALFGLVGCTTTELAATATGVNVAKAVYCNAITEEARQAVRDLVTGGIKVIPCLDASGTPSSVTIQVVAPTATSVIAPAIDPPPPQ